MLWVMCAYACSLTIFAQTNFTLLTYLLYIGIVTSCMLYGVCLGYTQYKEDTEHKEYKKGMGVNSSFLDSAKYTSPKLCIFDTLSYGCCKHSKQDCSTCTDYVSKSEFEKTKKLYTLKLYPDCPYFHTTVGCLIDAKVFSQCEDCHYNKDEEF